jgi:hypothetical protein
MRPSDKSATQDHHLFSMVLMSPTVRVMVIIELLDGPESQPLVKCYDGTIVIRIPESKQRKLFSMLTEYFS